MNRRGFLRNIALSTAGLTGASGWTDATTAGSECQHDCLADGEPCPNCDYVAPLPPPTTLGEDVSTEDTISLSWTNSLKDGERYGYRIRRHLPDT